VLEIVAKSAAAPVNEEGEAEVDIDALDNGTLLELEEYVNNVLDVRPFYTLVQLSHDNNFLALRLSYDNNFLALRTCVMLGMEECVDNVLA